MTITSNVPPPPRLTGDANTDLAAVTSWAYSMYRVLTTDGGGLDESLTKLRSDLLLITTALAVLSENTDSRFTATGTALDVLATAVDAVTARVDAIAAITPVPGVYTLADVKSAVNAIITAAAP